VVLRVEDERDGITGLGGYGVRGEGEHRVGTDHNLVVGSGRGGSGGDGENSGSESEMHLNFFSSLLYCLWMCGGTDLARRD